MPIEFYCPLGHRLRAPRRKAGREIRCPACNHRAIVPELGAGARSIGQTTSRPNLQPPVTDMRDGELASPEDGTKPVPPPLPQAGPEREASGPPGDEPRRASPALPADGSGSIGKHRSRFPLARHQGAQELALPMPGQTPQRARFRRRPRLIPADAYQPDAGKLQTVRWLAFVLALIVAFSTIPAWDHLNLQTAPDWARIVLLLAAMQGFYLLWMLAAPDWASVWVVMLVFAFVCSLYGMATAIAWGTPPTRPMPLDIGELRHAAPRWCGSVLALMALATYLCGHTGATWRRSYELEMATRTKTGQVRYRQDG